MESNLNLKDQWSAVSHANWAGKGTKDAWRNTHSRGGEGGGAGVGVGGGAVCATSTHACADDALPPTSTPQAWMSHEASINNNATLQRGQEAPAPGRKWRPTHEARRGRQSRVHADFLRNWLLVIQRRVHAGAYANTAAENLHPHHSQVCTDKRWDS